MEQRSTEMAKQQNVTYSDPHTSKSNPQPHVDVHSRSSDQAKGEKVGHANISSGAQTHGQDGDQGNSSEGSGSEGE